VNTAPLNSQPFRRDGLREDGAVPGEDPCPFQGALAVTDADTRPGSPDRRVGGIARVQVGAPDGNPRHLLEAGVPGHKIGAPLRAFSATWRT
jgi:hypothetical protein